MARKESNGEKASLVFSEGTTEKIKGCGSHSRRHEKPPSQGKAGNDNHCHEFSMNTQQDSPCPMSPASKNRALAHALKGKRADKPSQLIENRKLLSSWAKSFRRSGNDDTPEYYHEAVAEAMNGKFFHIPTGDNYPGMTFSYDNTTIWSSCICFWVRGGAKAGQPKRPRSRTRKAENALAALTAVCRRTRGDRYETSSNHQPSVRTQGAPGLRPSRRGW